MAKQLNISFKDNETEIELYNWIKSKLNPGTYAKELLYINFLEEHNGAPCIIKKTIQADPAVNNAIESTNVDTGEWDLEWKSNKGVYDGKHIKGIKNRIRYWSK